ncbi:MAG: hypothetical protein K2G96_01230, partial [Clostridia bacterium]|nr:hypothetical protein [Clostridia bacterium]
VTQYDDNGTLKDIVYDYSKTWTLTDFGTGAGWYDFANCITNTQYKYKNSGDTTAFDTANPGTAPTSGLHNAGRYKVEFTSNSIYGWNDPANPSQTTNTASFIITIKQKEIEYEPKLYKGNTAVTSLSYGDTGGVVKANVATVSDTGTLAPDIEIKYAGANGTVYAVSTTFPTAAGSYTATITDKNASTSNYKIKLKTGASNPLSFTIGKKEVTLPTLASATKTYNGTAQDFQIANFDPAVLDISAITADGNTLSSNSTYYDDGNGKYKVTPSLTAAPYKFTATEAAEYKVTFVIKTAAQTNYTWASSLNGQDKEITFTVEKKTLTITLTPPTAANNSWSFPMGTTGDITASALTGVENSDPVTFDVSYYNKPSTAGAAIPAPTIEQTDKAYTDIALDVSNFSSTGDYVVWIRLNDDSNGND